MLSEKLCPQTVGIQNSDTENIILAAAAVNNKQL